MARPVVVSQTARKHAVLSSAAPKPQERSSSTVRTEMITNAPRLATASPTLLSAIGIAQ